MTARSVLLLGVAMAISAIPTGLPTFVQAMLAYGAKQLAEAKAIVKNLTDVETLGATSAINTDKTGTLTLNEMMVLDALRGGHWYTVDGRGLRQDRRRSVGAPAVDGARTSPSSRYGLALGSDATVVRRRRGHRRPHRGGAGRAGREARRGRRGDPRGPTRGWPRCPSTRSTSSWRPSTRSELDGGDRLVELVKGGPGRRAGALQVHGADARADQVPVAEARAEVEAANARDGREGPAGAGLRRPRSSTSADLATMAADPMALTSAT